ncbi:hypothetical protein NDU88_003195 [Pleurodeles waltl]|uniref:Uncharacterized protein n=1 Tax=Pleurodeles waltl TaxID=8319 RepID=A0AAV7T5S5_PLEWA|nr:hypothetical protein NDU88_003195 [Pleurodeles waltl]
MVVLAPLLILLYLAPQLERWLVQPYYLFSTLSLQELIDSRQLCAGRLSRGEALAPTVKVNMTSADFALMDGEIQALQADWKQWEDSVFQAQWGLQSMGNQKAISQQEFAAQVTQMEKGLQEFGACLQNWEKKLTPSEGKSTYKVHLGCWHQEKVNSHD